MSNKKYYWLKLKENFFEDDTISWIEEQENGKEYCLFYLKLCLKSLKTDGILIRNVGKMLVPYDVKQLGKITNTDVDTVRVAMELFKNIGLIEILEGGEIYLNQLQNMVGSETSKAQLMRNKRARDKKIIESGNNVTKQLPNSYLSEEKCYTEKEKEKEKEKEVDIDIHTDEKIVNGYVSENLSSICKLYEKNIGPIYPANRDWFIEVSETIDKEMFKRAIEICIDRGNVTPGYLKGIIKKWTDAKIFTFKDLKAKEIELKNSMNKNNSKVIELKPNNSNLNEDVTEEELEMLRKLEKETGVF